MVFQELISFYACPPQAVKTPGDAHLDRVPQVTFALSLSAGGKQSRPLCLDAVEVSAGWVQRGIKWAEFSLSGEAEIKRRPPGNGTPH